MYYVKEYPREVYRINEDVTRANKRAWDQRQDRIRSRCLKLRPDYDHLTLRERSDVRKQATADIDNGTV